MTMAGDGQVSLSVPFESAHYSRRRRSLAATRRGTSTCRSRRIGARARTRSALDRNCRGSRRAASRAWAAAVSSGFTQPQVRQRMVLSVRSPCTYVSVFVGTPLRWARPRRARSLLAGWKPSIGTSTARPGSAARPRPASIWPAGWADAAKEFALAGGRAESRRGPGMTRE